MPLARNLWSRPAVEAYGLAPVSTIAILLWFSSIASCAQPVVAGAGKAYGLAPVSTKAILLWFSSAVTCPQPMVAGTVEAYDFATDSSCMHIAFQLLRAQSGRRIGCLKIHLRIFSLWVYKKQCIACLQTLLIFNSRLFVYLKLCDIERRARKGTAVRYAFLNIRGSNPVFFWSEPHICLVQTLWSDLQILWAACFSVKHQNYRILSRIFIIFFPFSQLFKSKG